MALTQNEIPEAISLAGNPIFVDYSTNQNAQDFIGIYYSVYAYLDSSWVLLGNTMRFEPDADNKVSIDIHTLLEWKPEKEFAWPEKVSNLIIKRNDLIRSYKINVYEMYGNPLALGASEEVLNLRVLPGKLSDLQFGVLNDNSTTWIAQQLSEKKFLTNSPRTKKTDAWSSERLYFLLTSAPSGGEINLNVKINYTDNTTSTIVRESQTGTSQYDMFEFITSFSTMGLYLHDTSKTVENYEVWLTDGSDAVISETFIYVLDHIRKPETKHFIFANAHKMPEGVRFTGKGKSTGKFSYQQSKRSMEKGFGVSAPSLIKSNTKETELRETSSEWLTIDEMNWMRELLLSEEVYEIINGHIVPIFIETSDVTINEEDKNLRSVKIKYSYAHADKVPALLPVTEDGLEAFQDTVVDFGDIVNATDPADQFDTWIFNPSTGHFGSQNRDEDDSYALSEVMSIGMKPVIFHYKNINAYLDYSDIIAGLTIYDDYKALNEVVEMNLNPNEGFVPLLTPESSSILVINLMDGSGDNQIDGDISLHYATRRYLEYLYENSL